MFISLYARVFTLTEKERERDNQRDKFSGKIAFSFNKIQSSQEQNINIYEKELTIYSYESFF